jgi:hypothetical protein
VAAPVVALMPILDQFLQIRGVGAVRPLGIAEIAWKTGAREPFSEIIDRRVGKQR